MTASAGHYRRRRIAGRISLYISAIGAALLCAGPFLWAAINALKLDRDMINANNNPFWFNAPPTFDHITYLFSHTGLPRFVWNSLWVGGLVVAITLVLALPAAYTLARFNRPWSGWAGIAIFLVYLVPPSLLFLSLSRMVVALGVQDSTWSLVVIYPTITIPISVWLLMGFLKAVPVDIEEQAMVDGYSRLAAIVRVVLPLALPGIISVVVFAFTLTASEFIYALAFISPTSQMPMSTGIPADLVLGDVFSWQEILGATVLIAAPIALVFNLFLDKFVAGFTAGAVKG